MRGCRKQIQKGNSSWAVAQTGTRGLGSSMLGAGGDGCPVTFEAGLLQAERGLSGWSDGLALEKKPPCRLGPPPRWCAPGGWSLWVRAVEGVQGTSG